MAVNKKNYNKNIKVSSATVAQLKKGTKASNIAKANAPGASSEFREAVRRFYGADVTKPKSMAGGKVVAKKTASRGNAPVSKPKSAPASKSYAKPSGKMGFANTTVTPESYKMNVGKDNLTPAQRREIAARQSTRDKVIGTAAQLAVPGTAGLKALKVGSKVSSVARGGKALQIIKSQKAIAKTAKGKATRLQNAAEAAKQAKARSEAAKRAAATRAKNAKKKKK